MSANTESRARQIKVGDTFRSTYADSNALWRVTRSMGRGVWEAIIDEPDFEFQGRMIPGDYNGVVDVFKAEHIRRCMAWQDMFTNLADEQTAWFESLPVGTVIHYCNGFEQFVRGEVVVMTEANTEARTNSRDRLGQKGLLPTALVGSIKAPGQRGGWFQSDIVSRGADGKVRYGHHAKRVIEGNGAWQPSITCIYEHPEATNYNRPGDPDPRTLPAIDLTPPGATDPDSEAVVRHYNEVRALLNETARDGMDALAKLTQVRAVLDRGPEFVTARAEREYRNETKP